MSPTHVYVSGEWGLFEYLLLGLAIGLVTLLHFLMEPMRWRVAYLPTREKNETARKVRDVLFCTALATYLLPFKLGIPFRIGLLRSRAALGMHYIGAVLALDGMISLCVWAACTAFFAWIAALHWHPPWYLWVTVVVVGLLVATIIVSSKHVAQNFLSRWHAALVVIDRPWARSGIAAALLVVDVASYWLRHMLLVLLVTRDPRLMVVGGASGVVATFAGIISGMPMGLLGYDATLIALLGAAGAGLDQAVLVVAINRAMNLGAATIVGVPAGMRLELGNGLVSILRKLRELGNGKV